MIARLRSPRKSIFKRPSFSIHVASYCVTIGASSPAAGRSGLSLHRHVVEHRILGDHDGGGVDAVLTALVDEAHGDVDGVLHLGVALVESAKFSRFTNRLS